MKDEPKKSPQEKSQRLEAQLTDLIKETKNFLKNASRSIFKFEKMYIDLSKKMTAHEKYLKDILDSNQILDETVGNVLVAIRQNEYLQAWYPSQHGFVAMKVAGCHPAKTKKSDMQNELF